MKDPGAINVSKEGISIKLDFKKVFAAVIKSALSPVSVISELVQSGKIEKTIEREAYLLIVTCFMDAMRQQLKEEAGRTTEVNGEIHIQNRKLNTALSDELNEKEYIFNCNQASDPKKLPMLNDFIAIYKQWLTKQLGYSSEKVEQYARDFPSYYANAFIGHWISGKYPRLTERCDHPRMKEWALTYKRELYHAELKKAYYRPVLGETDIALADLYVELDFRLFDPQERNRHPFKKTKYNGSIHDYFLNHFIPAKKSQAINEDREERRMMVLLGHPGHGKSSFCHRSIHDLLNDSHSGVLPFYIKLQNTDGITSNLKAALLDSIPAEVEPENWIKEKGNKCVFFLDGLDELYMARGLSNNDVLNILVSCRKLVLNNRNWYFVITSRHNYVESKQLHDRGALVLELDRLNKEQQKSLIERYKECKDLKGQTNLETIGLKEIYDSPQYEHIRELISLPILLQILLITDVDIRAIQSRSALYDRLFTKVLERKWDVDGKLAKYKKDSFKPKHLREYLAYLAYRIYQNPQGHLRKSDLEKDEVTKEFVKNYLNVNPTEGLSIALKDVLTVFYLHEVATSEQGDELPLNYTIEFLLKSLHEYLICEYVWRKTRDFFLEDTDSLTFKRVIDKVQELFANIRFTRETADYLREIIDADRECHDRLLKHMSDYLPRLTEYGFLAEYHADPENPPTFTAVDQSVNCFFGYFMILSHLNIHKIDIRQDDSKLDEKIKNIFGYRNGQVQKRARGLSKLLRLASDSDLLGYLQLSSFDLTGFDLHGANLEGTNLSGAILHKAKLNRANLEGANLSGAILYGADLIGAELYGAKLERAILHKADLEGAYLEGAYLEGTKLERAILDGANLIGAKLERAILEGAYLKGAKLKGARVSFPYWLEDLKYQHVTGADDIAARYKIKKELYPDGSSDFVLVPK